MGGGDQVNGLLGEKMDNTIKTQGLLDVENAPRPNMVDPTDPVYFHFNKCE